ncbi:glycosyltransferase family 2 protein [Nitrincola schmidtii]|uniref:glycosyltransferase family 2 protein n=1 Tax=Nitrincola schmidtii TaxID=1730894 RepID=UPI00124DA5A7|nr:glycosyltransferase family 2 protein [Nitrincola schmidtii]
MLSNAGCVIIGRNEGERLVRCLASVRDQFALVVYVDSGSSDNSVKNAETAGAKVVRLDMQQPFTAARARNTGLTCLLEELPSLEYVQFIDGDCELVHSWPQAAFAFLSEHCDVVIVCGRRRERFPESTTYNALCDLEWDTPIGETSACGGDAMMRVSVLKEVNAYNPALIAGEEPEMCHRLRMRGWKIYRLNEEMTLHDAAITKFSQWWKRVSRGGFAFAYVSWMYRKADQKIWVRETLRPVFWGIILPLVFIFGVLTQMTSLIVLPPLLILLLWVKITAKSLSTMSAKQSVKYGFFMVMAKFAEAMGVLKWLKDKMLQKRSTLIEYK